MTINDCQPIPADVLAAFRPVTVYSPSIMDVQRIPADVLATFRTESKA